MNANVNRRVSGAALLWLAACAVRPPAVASPQAAPGALASSAATTPTAPAPPPPSEDAAAVPISSRNPTWGSRDARVTIVEFADFQCPFSARVRETLTSLREKYGPHDLRIVWKNNPLPFHQNAKPAAEAAAGVFELAGSEAFWTFHDTAFKNQGSLSEDSYERWAKDAGVKDEDMPSYKAGLAGHKWEAAVEKDLSDGKAAGVQGTPTFFVNGVFIGGAPPFDDFKNTIDQELLKAQAKIASGTPESFIYVEMTKENKKKNARPAAKEEEGDKEDTKTVFKVPIGTSPILGGPSALVTIVEFGDFQCPFTSRAEPTLKALRDKYRDKIRFVWKNEPLPFHPGAEPAAEAAMEVRREKGDKGFWDVHDRFFASQNDLASGKDPDVEGIVRIASQSGADPIRIKKAIGDHGYKSIIEADEDLSEDFQANGTPHFFVDGRRLVGAQPPEKFEKIIDEEIAKAQDLVSKGTRPADVYDALTKDGRGPPEPEKKDVPKTLPAGEPARGNLSAKVVIHEWADFQCPFCGRVEPTVTQIIKDYGDRIKFVWHDLPLPMHPDAPLASQAGRETYAQKGPSAFWAMHDKMFNNQQKIKRDDLDGYARELNLNLYKWKAALDGSTHASEIEADKKAANDDGISGIPAFIIAAVGAPSGYYVSGAQSYGKFRRLIDRALGGRPAGPSVPTPAPAAWVPRPEPTVKTTILHPGDGVAAKAGDRLRVHYTGTFENGTKFDSSRDREAPFEFTLGVGEAVRGWDLGIAGMKVGEKRRFVVPPSLAYGATGRPGIAPNATLVFEVELLAVHPE